jgi:hypothetical protein
MLTLSSSHKNPCLLLLTGMFSFLLMFGDVVLFFVLIFSAPDLFDTASKQQYWCLFPPLALQLGIMNKFNCGCGLFLFIGDGQLEFGTILGMLVLDSIIYSCLAWYLGQVAFGHTYTRIYTDACLQAPLFVEKKKKKTLEYTTIYLYLLKN